METINTPRTEKKIKLSKLQKKVVKDLQGTYVLVTDQTVKGAWVSQSTKYGGDQYHIHNGVFWNLVTKGMIFQSYSWPFNYVLTEEGKTIKI